MYSRNVFNLTPGAANFLWQVMHVRHPTYVRHSKSIHSKSSIKDENSNILGLLASTLQFLLLENKLA